MLDWSEYSKLLVGLVAIVNPVGAVPMYLGLTEGRSERERQRTVHIATGAVVAILLLALASGELLLAAFGISIASFRVAGGILLLLMAISMMHARDVGLRATPDESTESVDKESVAVVPLAIPLLAGPGAISTVIVYAARHDGAVHYALLGVIILAVGASVWLALSSAARLKGLVGRTGMNIVTRLAGLVMAAIAVEIMANGLMALFPGWRT